MKQGVRAIMAGVVCMVLAIAISGCESRVDVPSDRFQNQVTPEARFVPDETHLGHPVLRDGDVPAIEPSLASGQVVFSQNCATCHGVDARGGMAHVDMTRVSRLRELRPIDQFRRPAEGFEGHQRLGDQLSSRDIWDAVMYVRSLAAQKPTDAEFEAVFGQNCATCHGKDGFADGPLSHHLEPPPRNFHDLRHLYGMSDREIFQVISLGSPWTAMPPWEDTMSEKDRWKLVDYVRSFSYREHE